MAGDATGQARTGGTEMSNAETLNQYIKELFDYWDGKNDDFEPIPHAEILRHRRHRGDRVRKGERR